MSSNKKTNIVMKEVHKEDSDSDSECDSDNPEVYNNGNEVIQVDFEGRSPIDSDYHGIKQLLAPVFLKAHINLSELTDMIIGQNYIGSVIKQCDVDDDYDDDDDDEMDYSSLVFGITTVINITQKKDHECIQQLTALLLELAEKHASKETLALIKEILGNSDNHTGLLINERFQNVPAQISIPMFENLHKEIKRANEKKMPYNFGHFIMIIKLYRKEAKKRRPAEEVYLNPEEEIICPEALASFEFPGETTDENLTHIRKILILDGKKLSHIINSVQQYINNE